MRPRVSVVIPTYNRSGALDRTLQSVFGQSERDVEVIVVDDGSTDGTPSMLAGYGSRIRVIRKENGGAGAARNAGIDAARGEFIAFLDDDDVWLPEKTREQLRLFDANPDAALASTGAMFVDERDRLDYVQAWSLNGRLFDRLLFHNPVITSSVMVRRSCLVAMPSLFRTDLAPVEDWELWIRISARHEMIVSPQALVRYTVSPKSAYRKAGGDRSRALYRELYEGLKRDPLIEARVRRQWRRILSNVHFLTGVKLYAGGDGAGARAELFRAIWKYPWRVRWRTAATMLLLPVGSRGALRRWATSRKAR